MSPRLPGLPWRRADRGPVLGWALGLALTALMTTALACAGGLALWLYQGDLRCYLLQPPLNHMQLLILSTPPLDCVDHYCWASMRLGANHGLACFFPRPPWP